MAWTFRRKEKSLIPAANETPDRPAHSLDNISDIDPPVTDNKQHVIHTPYAA
jgi:hypothetical protein